MICARNGHQIGWCKYSQIVSDGWTRDVKDFPGPGRRGQAARVWRATSGCKRAWTAGAIYRLSDRDGEAVNTAWVPVFQGTLPSSTPDRSCSVNRLRGLGVGIPTVSGVVWKDREALGGFSPLYLFNVVSGGILLREKHQVSATEVLLFGQQDYISKIAAFSDCQEVSRRVFFAFQSVIFPFPVRYGWIIGLLWFPLI